MLLATRERSSGMLRSSPGRMAVAKARKRQLLSSGITRSTGEVSTEYIEGLKLYQVLRLDLAAEALEHRPPCPSFAEIQGLLTPLVLLPWKRSVHEMILYFDPFVLLPLVLYSDLIAELLAAPSGLS